MGNVNTPTNKKSLTYLNKQLMLTEIQQKIQLNLKKQNKKIISELKTTQMSQEPDQIFTYRIQCQSARSLLENQPILSNR
ncbi:unnamed protein product [Paramecium pentaurelia]|uniref:Uncharacterized protein n=1 Tax=Paramecium pentaurelia TaxID=43138 RepID=A0A8S1XJT4_9CILI|nr:unnamed protein product [Paramecium pentaurelia]